MTCHRMGRPPISTIGLGRRDVSSLSRVPKPPARIMAFTHTSRAGFDCLACVTIGSRIHRGPGGTKRKMLMTKVAGDHCDHDEDSSSQVGCHLRRTEPAAKEERERR